ncbi:hypothetical protein PF005_g13188 [Phytophthora fragariae]|uniref:RxLR effector protein n=1 Tax=Phytophthora fragariae TaxID=53985 RepID=A0A6A3S9D4_9STRA|nr:hypothetical protein PF003_g36786 [Phytophthora fragariae]KAE8935665.1 hypothetical protein PF009_g14389 [Phytophthora fragariae]KAE9006665.1 hypothetical protein PF011_g11469 [Phytophthora fragariae]KAE9106056.1 hypothetical protein PF010_g12762 [Phytophthora fragariae]KAE9108061.1 hypothetical protein PF007_g12800 [Phytophthora fragariae]
MTRGHCAMLFFAFALFACTKGSFAATGVSATLQLRGGEPYKIVRGKRFLKSGQSTAYVLCPGIDSNGIFFLNYYSRMDEPKSIEKIY